MFPYANTPDFVRAIAAVTKEGVPVKEDLALSVIRKMYAFSGGSFGGKFREIRNRALEELEVTDLFDWTACKLVVGHYFNSRAVRAKKNQSVAQQMPICSASSQEVRIHVYLEIFITFRVHKTYGILEWNDVDNGTKEVLSGSSRVAKQHWVKAKRKAIAVMNDHRARVHAKTT